ncbi:MAG TPA: carbon storage regulator CsrA [Pirellulaceae bacterium]|nr:carbon storage regulator CsrA [Pirellulaceae bacterium]HMO92759.1 carbon storage regulator CsrA [Pirellulaceae bacterium]HMP69341.1 carbon storage regulator CsrA [Pirellulaceae bacterium]
MLVLSRKVGERILIGENIAVTVVRITGGGVRIGIEAPAELPVIREELQKTIEHSSSADITVTNAYSSMANRQEEISE